MKIIDKQINSQDNLDAQCFANIYFMLSDGSNLFDHDAVSARSSFIGLPKLESPCIEREHLGKVSTYEAMAAPNELLSHYQRIISFACSNGVKFDEYSHNFWLRLEIGKSGAKKNISFDWYDTLAEIERFIDWVKEGASNEYQDMDQHWEVIACRQGSSTEIIQRDPDNNIEVYRIAVSFNALKFALTDVLDSAKYLIEYLSKHVGEDVWTDYSSAQVMMGKREEVKFGTDMWKP